jgi:hypothetical protein
MNPALIITIIQAALALAPQLTQEIRLLLQRGDPSAADWEALRARLGKSYDDYINEAKSARGPISR